MTEESIVWVRWQFGRELFGKFLLYSERSMSNFRSWTACVCQCELTRFLLLPHQVLVFCATAHPRTSRGFLDCNVQESCDCKPLKPNKMNTSKCRPVNQFSLMQLCNLVTKKQNKIQCSGVKLHSICSVFAESRYQVQMVLMAVVVSGLLHCICHY